MSPARNSGGEGDSPDATERDSWIGAPLIEGEVTRVEEVKHYASALGHGVLSFVFLSVAIVLVDYGMVGTAFLMVGFAYAIVLNWVTSQAWDRLRAFLDAKIGEESPEMVAPNWPIHRDRVELLAMFILGTALVPVFGAGIAVLSVLSTETAVYLFSAVLFAGLLGTVAWAYRNR